MLAALALPPFLPNATAALFFMTTTVARCVAVRNNYFAGNGLQPFCIHSVTICSLKRTYLPKRMCGIWSFAGQRWRVRSRTQETLTCSMLAISSTVRSLILKLCACASQACMWLTSAGSSTPEGIPPQLANYYRRFRAINQDIYPLGSWSV